MTIQVEILQFLHYNPSSSRVEISAGLTEAPNERTLKRIIAELVQTIKKKEDTFKMAQANKAFAHFRF